jgi:hypothetical protein
VGAGPLPVGLAPESLAGVTLLTLFPLQFRLEQDAVPAVFVLRDIYILIEQFHVILYLYSRSYFSYGQYSWP